MHNPHWASWILHSDPTSVHFTDFLPCFCNFFSLFCHLLPIFMPSISQFSSFKFSKMFPWTSIHFNIKQLKGSSRLCFTWVFYCYSPSSSISMVQLPLDNSQMTLIKILDVLNLFSIILQIISCVIQRWKTMSIVYQIYPFTIPRGHPHFQDSKF